MSATGLGGFGGEQKGRHSESSMAYEDEAGEFCWKLKAENGEIIFGSADGSP